MIAKCRLAIELVQHRVTLHFMRDALKQGIGIN